LASQVNADDVGERVTVDQRRTRHHFASDARDGIYVSAEG
jgi:hypothetical protein